MLPGRCQSASAPCDSEDTSAPSQDVHKLDKVLFLPYYHRLCKVIFENVCRSQTRTGLDCLKHRRYLLPSYRNLTNAEMILHNTPVVRNIDHLLSLFCFSLSWTLTGNVWCDFQNSSVITWSLSNNTSTIKIKWYQLHWSCREYNIKQYNRDKEQQLENFWKQKSFLALRAFCVGWICKDTD